MSTPGHPKGDCRGTEPEGTPAGRDGMPAGRRTDVFLQPGEYFVGDAACRIRTVLGSCVSVTLWNPRQRVGAMSHFMLATRGAGSKARPGTQMLDARYGDEALHLMLGELAAWNVAASECKAKIFGGGDMFPGRGNGAAFTVGRRNGEAARALLEARGIELASESLYGQGHRQIMFDVSSGHVWSRQVGPAADWQRTGQGRGI